MKDYRKQMVMMDNQLKIALSILTKQANKYAMLHHHKDIYDAHEEMKTYTETTGNFLNALGTLQCLYENLYN